MRILLTGHGGFVGHHCLEYFLEKTTWDFVCIDSFRHKGTIRRVVEACDSPRVQTFAHDLSVPVDPQLESLLSPIDMIINFASESAVERSIIDPVSCLRNNYELMINMLELARRIRPKMFIQISTDEVFGEAFGKGHQEWSSYLPSSPYAASKAAQNCLAIAYWRTYRLPIVITHCMNLIGERQDKEKFLPKIIEKISKNEEMPIYANDGNIGSRVYLHARNMAHALLFLAKKEPAMYSDDFCPDCFNICGETEVNNLELAEMVAKIMGKKLKYKLIESESARPGYDRRYMLDGTKLRSLGWSAPLNLEESLTRVVEWSLKNPHWLV